MAIEDVQWAPLVNHAEAEAYRVSALRDCDDGLAARHGQPSLMEEAQGPAPTLRSLGRQAMGDAFAISG